MVRTHRLVIVTAAFVLGAGLLAGGAFATPNINSAVVNLRIWNDCPGSDLTFHKDYPNSIWINDANLYTPSGGWANRHNFRLSENNFTAAVFNNADEFSLFTDVTLSGTANEEGGINVSPWWSQDVDGNFTAITGNGEIAAFGGRLPFYSFNSHVPPVNYTPGETIRMGVNYDPHSLSQSDPGTIEYIVIKNSITYSSGVIAFDEGNPNEGHGTWGLLDDGRVGGYFMPQLSHSDPANWGRVDFGNLVFTPEPASLLLVALAGLMARRSR